MSVEKNHFHETLMYELSPIENSFDFLEKWIQHLQDFNYEALGIFTRRCLAFKDLLDNVQVVECFVAYAEQSVDKIKVYEMMIENKVGITCLQVYQNFIKLLIYSREFTEVAKIFKKSKRYVNFDPVTFKQYTDQISSQLISLIRKYDTIEKPQIWSDISQQYKRQNLSSEDNRLVFPIQSIYQEQSIRKLVEQCEALKSVKMQEQIYNLNSHQRISWLSDCNEGTDDNNYLDSLSKNQHILETPKSKIIYKKEIFSQQKPNQINSSLPSDSSGLTTPSKQHEKFNITNWKKTKTSTKPQIIQTQQYIQCIRANDIDQNNPESDRIQPKSDQQNSFTSSGKSFKFELNPEIFQSLANDFEDYDNENCDEKENLGSNNQFSKKRHSLEKRVPFTIIDMKNETPKSMQKLCMPRISETDSDLLNS